MENKPEHRQGLLSKNLMSPAAIAAIAASLAISLGATSKEPGQSEVGQPNPPEVEASLDNKNYTFRKLSGEQGGAWSFFGDPRSIGVDKNVYTGWIALSGFVQISQYNTETHKRKLVNLGPNLGRVDDHNNPSLLARKDGRIMAFYSPHSGRSLPKHGVSKMYYRTTKKPNDITKWGPIHKVPTNTRGGLGYTYPNPIELDKGKVLLAWRGGNWQPTFATTSDHGKSWSHARSFFKSRGAKRPYVKYAEGPKNSVSMAYNQDNPGTTSTGLYYMQYRPGQGYFDASGKKISHSKSTIATARGDMIMSRHKHGRTYVMDIATDKKGDPAVIFTTKPRRGGASVYYAKWDGKHWRNEFITSEGYGLYSKKTKPKHYGFYPTAGMSLDHNDPSKMYISRQVDHQMRVEKWERSETGEWKHEFVSPKEKNCFRPASVRGMGEKVVMMCGDYTNWLVFNTDTYIAEPKQP